MNYCLRGDCPIEAWQGNWNDDCGLGVLLKGGLVISETETAVFIAAKRTVGAAQGCGKVNASALEEAAVMGQPRVIGAAAIVGSTE